MALSSTASSGASGSTHSCALGSVQPPGCASMEHESRPKSGHRRRTKSSDHRSPDERGEAKEQLRELSVSPPPSKHKISQFTSPKSEVTKTKPNEYTIIPIVLASSPSFRSVAVTQTMSQSAGDIRRPIKSPQMQNKKTQTLESVHKSHKHTKKCQCKSRRQDSKVSSCQTDIHHPEREQQDIQPLMKDQRCHFENPQTTGTGCIVSQHCVRTGSQ